MCCLSLLSVTVCCLSLCCLSLLPVTVACHCLACHCIVCRCVACHCVACHNKIPAKCVLWTAHRLNCCRDVIGSLLPPFLFPRKTAVIRRTTSRRRRADRGEARSRRSGSRPTQWTPTAECGATSGGTWLSRPYGICQLCDVVSVKVIETKSHLKG